MSTMHGYITLSVSIAPLLTEALSLIAANSVSGQTL